MSQHIDAVYENGVFRPETPVNIANGERVALSIETQPATLGDLSEVWDLLDIEFMGACRQGAENAPLLEEVQKALSTFHGSLADRISEERDER